MQLQVLVPQGTINTVNASGIVTAANVSTGGSVTAVSFYGDGQNLTGVLKQETDTLQV